MLTYTIDGNKLYVTESLFPDSAYEIIDHVPLGYCVWAIGEHMPDGYLPLCRLMAQQPFPGARWIELDTLKAIQCEGAQIIINAACYGPGTLAELEAYLKWHRNIKPGMHKHAEVQEVKAALPYMKKIKWGKP